MNDTLAVLARQHFTQRIPLAWKPGVRMWAEFSIDTDGWTVRFFVRRGGNTGMWYNLADACADYEGRIEATTFVVEERA